MEGAPATAAGGAEGRGVPEAETAAAGEAKLAEETEAAAVYSGPGSVPQEVSGASGTDEAGAFVQERAGELAAALVLEDGPGASAAAVPEGAPEETEAVPISPLTGARVREEKAALVSDYRQRLEDLDNQIQKMREEDAAESASNVYSIKTSAETELKLWEGEMGTIYNGLLELLSQEDAAALAAEQQEWLKNRDLKAAEGTVRNSSVESLGYAATLVSLTRDRLISWLEDMRRPRESFLRAGRTKSYRLRLKENGRERQKTVGIQAENRQNSRVLPPVLA